MTLIFGKPLQGCNKMLQADYVRGFERFEDSPFLGILFSEKKA